MYPSRGAEFYTKISLMGYSTDPIFTTFINVLENKAKTTNKQRQSKWKGYRMEKCEAMSGKGNGRGCSEYWDSLLSIPVIGMI